MRWDSSRRALVLVSSGFDLRPAHELSPENSDFFLGEFSRKHTTNVREALDEIRCNIERLVARRDERNSPSRP